MSSDGRWTSSDVQWLVLCSRSLPQKDPTSTNASSVIQFFLIPHTLVRNSLLICHVIVFAPGAGAHPDAADNDDKEVNVDCKHL